MQPMGLRGQTRALASGTIIGLILHGYVGRRFITHATPARALAGGYEPFAGVVESI